MPSRFDSRHDPEAKELLKKIPKIRHQPLVGAADLREVAKVFAGIPELTFPINSAGELVDSLGGGDQALRIAEVDVDPVRMIKYMPAYYFPIVSIENFVEKMAELVRANRKQQSDVPKALEAVKKQLPQLKFPISGPDELHRALQSMKTVKFNNKEFKPKDMVDKVHKGFFPVNSQDDFDRKVSQLIQTRELIVKD
ncbi:MAG TPA: hypothetical protein VJR02_17040 [Pyrinomonadaceae bacterium]|nr:hypothetical protein [Pyrinomonadaceae bacterium]